MMKSNSPERDTGGGSMEKQMKNYACKFCDLDYVFRNDCKLHALSIHGEKTYDCDACPELFYDEKELSEHTKTVHRGQKRNFCTLCARSYKTARQLTMHIDYKHKIENATVCEKCGQEFHNNTAYRKHLQLHHKPNHIYEKCSECDRSFRFSHHLTLHKQFDHRKGGKKKLLEYMKTLNIDKSLTTLANRCKSCNIKFKCSIDLIEHLKLNHARKVRKFTCCQCKEAVYLSRAALGIHMRYDHGMLNHSCSKCPPPKKPSNPAPLKRKKSKPKSVQNVTPYVSKQGNKGRRRINDGSMFSLYNININSPNIKLSEKAKKRTAPWADRFKKENIPSDLESVGDGNLENLRHNIRTVFNILSTVAPSRLKASVTSHLSSVTSRNVFGKNVNVLSIMFPSITPSLPQRMSSNIESSNTSVPPVKKPFNPLKALDKPNVNENVIKNKSDIAFEKSNTNESFNTDNSLNRCQKSSNTVIDIGEPNITPNAPKEKKRKRMIDKINELGTFQSNHEHSCENATVSKSASTTKALNQSVSGPLKKRKICHENSQVKIDNQKTENKKKEDRTVETTKSSRKETTSLQLYKIPKITVKNFSKDMVMLNSIKNVKSFFEEPVLNPVGIANVINVEKEDITAINSLQKEIVQTDTNVEDSQPKIILADSSQDLVEIHTAVEINALESSHLQENSTSSILNVKEPSHIQEKSTKKHEKSKKLSTEKKKVSSNKKIHQKPNLYYSQNHHHKALPEIEISKEKLCTRKMLKSHKKEPQMKSAMSKVKSVNIEKAKDVIKFQPETQSELEMCSENIPSPNINEKSSIQVTQPTDNSSNIYEETLSKKSCTTEDTSVKQISDAKKAKKEKQNHPDKEIEGESQSGNDKVSKIDNFNNLDSKPMSKNKTRKLLPKLSDIQDKLYKNKQSSAHKTKSESRSSSILKKKEKQISTTDTVNTKSQTQTSPHKEQSTIANSIDKEVIDDLSNTVEKELSILFDMPISSLKSQSEESNLTNNKEKTKPLPGDTTLTIEKVVLNPNIASPTSGKRRHNYTGSKRTDIKRLSSNEGKPERSSNSLPVGKTQSDSDKVMPPKSPSTEKTNTVSPHSPKKNVVPIDETVVSADQNNTIALTIPLLETPSEQSRLTENKEKSKLQCRDTHDATMNKVVLNPSMTSPTSDKRRHKSKTSKRMNIKSPPSNEGKSIRHSNSLTIGKRLSDSDRVMPPKSPSKEKTNTVSIHSPKKNVVPISETVVSADQNNYIVLPIPTLETPSEQLSLSKNKEKPNLLPRDTHDATMNKVVLNLNMPSPTSDKGRHDTSKRMDIKSPPPNEGKPTKRSNSLPVVKSQCDSDKAMSPSKEKTNTLSPKSPKKKVIPIDKTSPLVSAIQNKSSKNEVQISPLFQEIPLSMEQENSNTAKSLDLTVQEVTNVFKKSTSPQKKSDTQSNPNVKAKSSIKKDSVSTPLKSSNTEIHNLKNKEDIVPLSEKTSQSTILNPNITTQTLHKRRHKSDPSKRMDIKSPSSNEGISTRRSNLLPMEKIPNRKRKSDDTFKVVAPKLASKEKINKKYLSSPKKHVQTAKPLPQICTDRENLPNTNFVDPKKGVIKSSLSQERPSSTEEEIQNIVKPVAAIVQELAKSPEKKYSPEKESITPPATCTNIKTGSPIKKVNVIPVANKVILSNPEVKSPEKIQSPNLSPVKPITAKRIIITKDMIIKSSPCKNLAPKVLHPGIEGLRLVMSASKITNSSNIDSTNNPTGENRGNMTNNTQSLLDVINTECKFPVTQIASKIYTGDDTKKPIAQQMQSTNYNHKKSDSVSLEKLVKSATNDNKNEKTEESKILTSEDEDNGKRIKKLQILLHRVDDLLIDKNKEIETIESVHNVNIKEDYNDVTNTGSQINYEEGIPMDDYHLSIDSSFCLPESHFEEVQYDETGQNVLEVANYVDVETTGSPSHSKTNSPVPMISSPIKEYTCTFCCMKFEDEIFLLNHLTEVHTYDKNGSQTQSCKTLYKCRSCGSGFRQKDVLDKHIKEEHVNTGAYNCEHCSATYLYKYHLKRHVRKVHPAVLNATRDICMKKFDTFAALDSHICGISAEQNVPSNEEIIEKLPANEEKNSDLTAKALEAMNEQEQVNDLNSPLKKQVRFSDVIKEAPGEDKPVLSKNYRKYRCNKCKSSFQSGLFLFNHARLYHKDTILKCGSCKLEFLNSTNFKQHVCKTVTKFECKKCLLLFTNRNALVEHRKEKHNMGTLKCDFCSKYFKTNTNLVKHIAAKHIGSSEYTNAVNLPSKKIKCRSSSQVTSDIYDDLKIINQASSQPVASEVLVKSRSNVKNPVKLYKRNICKKNIKPKKDIILHSELKHRYHKCLKCARKFSNKALLLKHIKCEHKIEPNKIHRCTECSAVFKFLDKLLQHHKMKHGQCETGEKLLRPSKSNVGIIKIRKQRISKAIRNKEQNPSTKKELTTDTVIAQDISVGLMYSCAECKAYLPSKDSLQRHMQWEHMKVGKCGHCGEVLATAEEFLRHLMTGHANEKIKEVLPAQLALPESSFKWKTQLAYKHERQAE